MSHTYQVSFNLSNTVGETYNFNTIMGDDAIKFRDFLNKGDRKCLGVLEKSQLFRNENTDKNAQYLVEKFDIDLFSMSDDEIKDIGLERIKDTKPETHAFVGYKIL